MRNILIKGPFKYLNVRFPYPFIYLKPAKGSPPPGGSLLRVDLHFCTRFYKMSHLGLGYSLGIDFPWERVLQCHLQTLQSLPLFQLPVLLYFPFFQVKLCSCDKHLQNNTKGNINYLYISYFLHGHGTGNIPDLLNLRKKEF